MKIFGFLRGRKKAEKVSRELESRDSDPSGSYTGVNVLQPGEEPEQDADDL